MKTPVSSSFNCIDQSVQVAHAKSRVRFISLCNAILYSKDDMRVAHAYETLFTTYKYALMSAHPDTQVSCFEEVVVKMIRDEDTCSSRKYRMLYDPYQAFISLIKEQHDLLSSKGSATWAKKKEAGMSRYMLLYMMSVNGQLQNEHVRFTMQQAFRYL